MFKLVFRIVVFLTVVVVVINLGGNFVFGKAMTEVLGTQVEVGKLRLNPLSGEAGLYGLNIKNPNAFEKGNLASIPEVSLKFDFGAIFKKQIHIKEIRFSLSEVSIERNHAGKFNLIELKPVQESMGKQGSEGGSSPMPQEEPTRGRKEPMFDLFIDEVSITFGKAKYIDYSSAQAGPKEINLGMKEILLHNVTDPADLVEQIVFKTMQVVGMNALFSDFGQFSALLSGQASAKINSFVEKVKKSF